MDQSAKYLLLLAILWPVVAGGVGCGPGASAEPSGRGALLSIIRLEQTNVETLRVVRGPSGTFTLALMNWGAVDLGDGLRGNPAANVLNLFLARLDASGQVLWARDFGHAFDRGTRLSLDVAADGRTCLAVGRYFGQFSLGGVTIPGQVAGTFATQSALGCYSDAGIHEWSRGIRSLSEEHAIRVYDLKLGADSSIWLVGSAETIGVADRGGYVTKLDSAGNPLWETFPWGFPVARRASRVALAADGRSLVTSTHPDGLDTPTADTLLWLDPDTGARRESLSTPRRFVDDMEVALDGNGDILTQQRIVPDEGDAETPIFSIDKLGGGDGTHRWSWLVGTGLSADFVGPGGLATDSLNNVLVTGSFRGSVLIGERVLTTVSDALYVMKLDENGDALWSRFSGGTRDAAAADVSVDDDDRVRATGYVKFETARSPTDSIFVLEFSP